MRDLLKKIKDMMNTMPFQSIGSLNIIKEIESELEKPCEPVAWLITRNGVAYDFCLTKPDSNFLSRLDDVAIPVYTSPPEREPLTSQEINIIAENDLEMCDFARAIEAAVLKKLS
jgi:hypothetical protein